MADNQPKEVAPNVWRVLDPNHGRFYYYNRATGETSWTAPPGVTEAPPAAPPPTPMVARCALEWNLKMCENRQKS